ncbi:hypothetical protein [Microbacterium arborescens]|jgi:hypothetical protein|uniref:hypothetical protein n=1 Tax=Microbacterium arborescens TaxID=33883 RepID=UPI0007E92758|nr:hypothetical protein [Microbacterium arborescens]
MPRSPRDEGLRRWRTLRETSAGRLGIAAVVILPVLLASGCANPVGLEGGETYAQARDRFVAMATGVHTVVMAIEPTEWRVVDGSYGAHPTGCQRALNEGGGYRLVAVRGLELPGRDPREVAGVAVEAFASLGIDSHMADRGQGEAREVTVVAEGGMAERAVVSIRPATGQVRVSAETECAPGSAHDLATEVFAEERLPDDVWRRPRRLARKRGSGGGGIRILWRVDGGGSRGQSCPISASRCRRGMSGWGHGQ